MILSLYKCHNLLTYLTCCTHLHSEIAEAACADGGAENAGVENAGVENAGVKNAGGITYGKPSEQKTLKIPGV